VAAAPNPFPDLRWTDRGTARLVSHRAPRSRVISDANDLYADGSVVLAATFNGISRSTDGGRHWRSVLSGIRMNSVTRGPTGYSGLGVRRNPDRAIVATSRDGIHWRARREDVRHEHTGPGFGAALVMDGPVGVAVNRVDLSFLGPMWRTTDGGRVWSQIKRFGQTALGGLRMSASGTIVATAAGQGTSCRGAVYRSTNLGATWAELPGSCSSLPLWDVQFVDADHGVAVGGATFKGAGGQVIETTADGGRTWTVTRYIAPDPNFRHVAEGFDTVDFVTPSVGYVLDGICEDGQGAPCAGNLYRTTDSGRHLTAIPSSSLSKGWLSVAATADNRFVVSGGGAGEPDGVAVGDGTTGRLRNRIRPRDVFSDEFQGVDATGFWHNTLGTFATSARVHRWHRVHVASLRGEDVEDYGVSVAPPGYVLSEHSVASPVVVRASSDGGTRWTDVKLTKRRNVNQVLDGYAVGPGGSAAALVGSGYGERSIHPSLLLSSDGGRRWKRAGHVSFTVSTNVEEPLGVALNRRVLVVLNNDQLEISSDHGRTWQASDLPGTFLCGVSAYRSELWLECPTTGPDATWILHSGDRGRRWSGHSLGVSPDTETVVATGPGSAEFASAGSIWRTVDGGATWRQSWPRLSGER
jgi:hypothetical protein